MDAFKIENYEREHGAGTFIPFRHLSESEANYGYYYRQTAEAYAKEVRVPS